MAEAGDQRARLRAQRPGALHQHFTLLVELVRRLGAQPDERSAEAVGRLAAHLWTLRRMSISVAGMLQAGEMPISRPRWSKTWARPWSARSPRSRA